MIRRSHAVVVGASMGGLLASRVLADAFEHVTILDRDELPTVSCNRKGVPQGRHAHALLFRGQQALDELFPGLVTEIADAGAPLVEAIEEVRFEVGGHEMARASTGSRILAASRPLIESSVRSRVRALPNVVISDRCDVVDLLADETKQRVTGVRVARRGAGALEDIAADLVVVATGRAGRITTWLEALGFARPPEDEVHVGVAYASRYLRLRPGAVSDKLVVSGPMPGRPRGIALFLQEEDRWMCTLFGYAGDHPPSQADEFLRFAGTVAPPDVLAALVDADPLSDVVTHRVPSNLRRRYDKLARFPDGLLVFGDAICSFNPFYGQGMTVAALEALALERCLKEGDHRLAHRFFRASSKPVDRAWTLAVGADLALPEVLGPRPLLIRVLNPYLARLQAVSADDSVVALAFYWVAGMVKPPLALLRPNIALRVLRGSIRTRAARAAGEAGLEPAV